MIFLPRFLAQSWSLFQNLQINRQHQTCAFRIDPFPACYVDNDLSPCATGDTNVPKLTVEVSGGDIEHRGSDSLRLG